MRLLHSIPAKDGFSMPAEFEPHQGTVMIWPVRPGSWMDGGKPAQEVFARIARIIAKKERVYLLTNAADFAEVTKLFGEDGNIRVIEIETNDAWARDIAPTFVRRGGVVRGISWCFNAWGGEVDGLYTDYIYDDMAAERICEELGLECYDAYPFVLEGGSIHSDGEGTLLVTESCLLSPGRNPYMAKKDIEEKLIEYLNVEKVIWLPRGIYLDETNEHVDNICAFTRPGEVVLAWCDDENDPQYELSSETLRVLERSTDAKGRRFLIRKLKQPRPILVKEEDLSRFSFAPGEAEREAGERLAASYVNFYICNAGILVPQFGDPADAEAVAMLGRAFPGRDIYPVEAMDILLGGGNIHCITQQIPAVHEGAG